MKSKKTAQILLVVVIVVCAGWLFNDKLGELFSPSGNISVQTPPVESRPAVQPQVIPERIPMPPRHPVAPNAGDVLSSVAKQPELPFPTDLEQADAYLRERLPQLIDDGDLLVLVNLNYFIQKLVLFIDNLPEKSIPRLHLPITPPKPGFLTSNRGEQQVIGKRNAARYTAYVKLIEAIPDAVLLKLYRGLYPLFQQAYRESGDSKAHFNDRLIQVIDDLQQTPEPVGPISVVHHVSRFKYTDETLESRSAGQKILLRMGVENTRRVKEKLLHFRQSVVRKEP